MKQRRWTFTRLFGMLAILGLGAVQQPNTAKAAEMQPCFGVPGC